jgi:peptide/nickel transport system substrate-binding protein
MRRIVVTCAVVAVILAAGSAPAGGQSATPSPEEKVTFTVGVTYDLNSANPIWSLDGNEWMVHGLEYDGLLRYGREDYALEREMVDSYETSADGLTWTFHLKDGLTWSDGQPVTADDFVWTANFIIDNDIALWSDGYRYTKDIVARDDRTIVWTTTRPSLAPGWPGYNLTLPKHVWDGMSKQDAKDFKNFPDPVVSGPYRLVEWETGEYWKLEARDDYYGGEPLIDELVFRVYNNDEAVIQALLKGAIDYTEVPTSEFHERLKDEPGIESVATAAEGFYQLSFNLASDPSSTANPAVLDPEVRRAVDAAIDKETLIDRVLGGYGAPANSPIAAVYPFWHWDPPPDQLVTFDPARARSMLDDAGYLDSDGDGIRELPGSGEPLQLRLFTSADDKDGNDAAEYIQSWLRDVGIDTAYRTMAWSKLLNIWYDFDWDLLISSWSNLPDPDWLLSSFTTGQCGSWSDTCYSNPTYDDLYAEQQATLDRSARQAIVFEMQEILYRDMPEIQLWYPNFFEAWRSDRWTGFLPWPEPDGLRFHLYSIMNIRPVTGVATTGPDAGPPGVFWIAVVALTGLLVLLTRVRHRRADAYYA